MPFFHEVTKKKNHFEKAANKYGNNTATADTGCRYECMTMGFEFVCDSERS